MMFSKYEWNIFHSEMYHILGMWFYNDALYIRMEHFPFRNISYVGYWQGSLDRVERQNSKKYAV